MKKTKKSIYNIFFLLFLFLALPAYSQKIVGSRIEITNRLDDRISQDVKDILAPYSPSVDSLIAPVVGRSLQFMMATRPESLLSNLVSDILLNESRKYGKKADLAICNIGGLRSALPVGNVTLGDILEIAPFENKMCIVKMRGKVLTELMQQIAKREGEGVSHGVQMVIGEGKLKSLLINGKPVIPSRLYTIATIDYVAEGNDGMTAFKKAEYKHIYDSNVREVYVDYFRSMSAKNRAVSSTIEGRIVREEPVSLPSAHIYVVHTNDTHSTIMPYNPNSSDKDLADKGGFLRRTVIVDSLRREHPEMLLLDCGDFSQGSAYYNIYKGEVEVKFMNYMKYDACTIGNHEFDFGLDNMARIFRQMTFPVVCCNYDFSATVLKDIVKPYAVIERAGKRIGITGVGCALKGMVSDKNCPGVVFLDPAASADSIAHILKNQEKCDYVICLSHLGLLDSEEYDDETFIGKTHFIDMVVGGHSHTYLTEPRYFKNADGIPVSDNQQGKHARYIGVIEVDI